LRPAIEADAIEVVVRCSAVVAWVFLSSACVGCIASSEESNGWPDAGVEGAPSPSVATVATNATESPTPAATPIVVAPMDGACPADMVLVDGAYCPDVKQTCLRWLDQPGPYEFFRCAVYGKPQCLSSAREPLRFCIDRYEYTPPNAELPAVHQSWTSASAVCASEGKRLCMESEWQLACEGPDMHAYPYGDGFHRDATACNIDRLNLGRPNSGLRDLREPAGSRPRCVSPYGVFDMSGNVEEWTTLDHPSEGTSGARSPNGFATGGSESHSSAPKEISSMKGAWWLPGRNHCRAATTGHGQIYEGPQVGVRCCKAAT
jgi:hypothetical protein